MNAIDTIELLARSEHRVGILNLLCENGSLEKHVLGDRIDASRTTIGRSLDALEEQGWVNRTNGTCTITRQGELVAEAFADLVGEVELTDKLQSFMQWVPDGTLDLDLSLLTDAKVTLAQPGDPYAMINKQVQLIKETEWYRVVLPFTGLHATEAANEQIVGNGAEGELVVEPDIADLYCSAREYADLWGEMEATGRLELFAYDGTLPYSLGVFDDTVQIVVAEGDAPRALLETTNETVREWALEQYRSYKRHADGFSVS